MVPGARPHGVGTPPRDDWILQGRRGAKPTRVARRPGPFAQATRAAWIYIAMLTQPASLPAPRHCFSPSAPHEWPSIGALADRRCPATISICVAIRVEAARPGSYSGYLDLVASLEAWNGPDQWLAAKGLSTPPGFIASPLHRVVPLRRGDDCDTRRYYRLPTPVRQRQRRSTTTPEKAAPREPR